MKTLRAVPAILLAATAALSLPAPAALFRAYLSTAGNDANPCTLAQPCRLLPAALTAVADGGEVWMLDSGNYNAAPVAIDKSVSIQAVPGAVASLVATNAITPGLAAQTPGVELSLRNIVFTSTQAVGVGLRAWGVTLRLEGCAFHDLDYGLQAYGGSKVVVTDSTFTRVRTQVIQVEESTATIARSRFVGNGNGLLLNGPQATLSVEDSLFAFNTSGVEAVDIAAACQGPAKAFVVRSQFIGHSAYALTVQTYSGVAANAYIEMNGNVIVKNTFGVRFQAPGIVQSASNNRLMASVTSDYYGPITATASY